MARHTFLQQREPRDGDVHTDSFFAQRIEDNNPHRAAHRGLLEGQDIQGGRFWTNLLDILQRSVQGNHAADPGQASKDEKAENYEEAVGGVQGEGQARNRGRIAAKFRDEYRQQVLRGAKQKIPEQFLPVSRLDQVLRELEKVPERRHPKVRPRARQEAGRIHQDTYIKFPGERSKGHANLQLQSILAHLPL